MKPKTLTERLFEAEKEIIVETLARHNGSRLATYIELGLSKAGLWNKMARHGLVQNRHRRFLNADISGPESDVLPAMLCDDEDGPFLLRRRMREYERLEILAALQRFGFACKHTARFLGISEHWLWQKMRFHKIHRKEAIR